MAASNDALTINLIIGLFLLEKNSTSLRETCLAGERGSRKFCQDLTGLIFEGLYRLFEHILPPRVKRCFHSDETLQGTWAFRP
jgi:hypothetical protein